MRIFGRHNQRRFLSLNTKIISKGNANLVEFIAFEVCSKTVNVYMYKKVLCFCNKWYSTWHFILEGYILCFLARIYVFLKLWYCFLGLIFSIGIIFYWHFEFDYYVTYVPLYLRQMFWKTKPAFIFIHSREGSLGYENVKFEFSFYRVYSEEFRAGIAEIKAYNTFSTHSKRNNYLELYGKLSQKQTCSSLPEKCS